jgi:ArsR family transcriptional regulator
MAMEDPMPQQTIFEIQAELCRCMSNPVRIMILHTLRPGPMRVTEIAAAAGQPQATISRHLAVLRSHGIVSTHPEGQERICEIANPKIVHICDLMREILEEEAAQRARLVGEFQNKLME